MALSSACTALTASWQPVPPGAWEASFCGSSPPRSVAAGVPAKVMKELDGSAEEWLDMAYEEYTELSERYKKGARIISE